MAMGEIMKAAASKTLVIKINLIFLAFLLIAYLALLLQPSTVYQHRAASIVRCTLRNCHAKKIEDGGKGKKTERMVKEEIPSFLNKLHGNSSIALVNIGKYELLDWQALGAAKLVEFERVSENFEWRHIFPEWIDEEEENEGPSCPEIPMPDFSSYGEFDVVVVKLPCRRPEPGWSRDVFRLQVHLIAANLAVRRVKRNERGVVKLVFYGRCRPMMEVFRCDDMVGREGEWWLYEVEAGRLEEKMAMPVGSCKLALPLWSEGLFFYLKIYMDTLRSSSVIAFLFFVYFVPVYNGGDQGFLNEIFVWWHRLPRRVNFLKNFWSNKTAEMTMKNHLFASDPPKLYSIHYLGLKPWLCYRDYDCNWNVEDQKIYASDFAHVRWWRVHDEMGEELKKFCGLTRERKEDLERDRRNAEELGFRDGHWKINVTDWRRNYSY